MLSMSAGENYPSRVAGFCTFVLWLRSSLAEEISPTREFRIGYILCNGNRVTLQRVNVPKKRFILDMIRN